MNWVKMKYLLVLFCCAFFSCKKDDTAAIENGMVKLSFVHQVKTEQLRLGSTLYTNSTGETYSVSKLKYYISNIAFLSGSNRTEIPNSYYLIDESGQKEINIPLAVGTYSAVEFVIGVDSARNTSGAQTGALDPLNDMFWTWNSGYIMAKLEGNSSASTVVNNKMEYHIGGFSGINNVLQKVSLTPPVSSIPQLVVSRDKSSTVAIAVDIDRWFGTALSIRNNPVITTPGIDAKIISMNYRNMFSIKSITN